MPPVRGRERAVVAVLLVGAASTAGALVGFALGVAGAVVGLAVGDAGATRALAPSAIAAAAVVAVAALADVAVSRGWLWRPLALRRQVPREWSDLFAPGTVAVLYGARLGVGPLTLLPTWLWWAAALLGALLGPGPSTLAGATFGLVRGVVLVGVGAWVTTGAPAKVARLVRAEPASRWAALAGALALAAPAALAS